MQSGCVCMCVRVLACAYVCTGVCICVLCVGVCGCMYVDVHLCIGACMFAYVYITQIAIGSKNSNKNQRITLQNIFEVHTFSVQFHQICE